MQHLRDAESTPKGPALAGAREALIGWHVTALGRKVRAILRPITAMLSLNAQTDKGFSSFWVSKTLKLAFNYDHYCSQPCPQWPETLRTFFFSGSGAHSWFLFLSNIIPG